MFGNLVTVRQPSLTTGRKLLDDELRRFFFDNTSTSSVHYTMRTYTENDSYFIEAELPGVDPQYVNIESTENTLTFSVDRDVTSESSDGEVQTKRETYFEKQFRLPFHIDAKQVHASSKHGLLTIKIDKPEAAKPKTIQIALN